MTTPTGQGLLECLLIAAKLEGRPTTAAALTSGLPLEDGKLTPQLFVRAANRAGMAGLLVERTLDTIKPAALPSVLMLKDGNAAVLTELDFEHGFGVLVSPDEQYQQFSLDELAEVYDNHLFLLRPMQQFDQRSPKIYPNTGQHWFWGVIKSSSSIYRDVLIASLLINLFVLAQPLFVMNVYDRVVPNNAFETLWALTIGIFVVYLFDLLLKGLRSYFVELAAKRSDVILSSQLFERVLNLKMKHRPVSVGAFANRLHEFDALRNFITSSTILTLVDIPFLILFVIVMAFLGGWLVAVPLLALPIAVVYGIVVQKKLRPAIENVMRASSRKNAILVEGLIGVETVKSLGAESKVQHNWEQSVGYVSQWGLQTRATSNTVLQVVQFLQQLAMVSVVVWGVYLIADHSLSLGGLIACVILNGRIMAPLGQIAGLLSSYDHAEATLKSLNEIMALPVERDHNKRFLHRPVLRGDIQFKGVTFSYPEQANPALSNINIQIRAGERIGIIGRIGSGKSSLAKLLLRLYEPGSGSVTIDGFDLQQVDPADTRNNIGYLSQDVTLFYGTIRDNIAYGVPAAEDAEIVAAAEGAGVADFINRHPLGYEMPVGERGETLSGGQRQAIGLARVLLRNPQIYLLDEPTASMDMGSEQRIREQLKVVTAGKTLILATHKSSMLELVDRLVVLDQGSVVADGPKDQILEALKEGKLAKRG
ncbi:type I secretion system permease/ATPase [Porticoccus sp. W117]|uniref:type I secretion system permease/ATPase n=1 Tax=Porticoccus sp. W117 TaxID=3054777 RepID=UPI002595B855|nr:type I secretion system permease/ATPase [Porticoccus sp. W117]MDM3872606.1 type I secretion system permease/ATPase [Porticoccus sp. W117]